METALGILLLILAVAPLFAPSWVAAGLAGLTGLLAGAGLLLFITSDTYDWSALEDLAGWAFGLGLIGFLWFGFVTKTKLRLNGEV